MTKNPRVKRIMSRNVCSFIGKDGSVWKKCRPPLNVRTRQSNLVIHLPGVKAYGKNAKSIIDCWSLFFSDDFLTIILDNTNKYINKMKDKYSRDRSARNTDLLEIKALLGLLYLAVTQKHQQLKKDAICARRTARRVFCKTCGKFICLSHAEFQYPTCVLLVENQV